ncbi:MAG: hypothetical protein AAGC46_00105 [Solirubrobacteraceae bacterium]|nr:hypothetical protein [Patulibacter sp.]
MSTGGVPTPAAAAQSRAAGDVSGTVSFDTSERRPDVPSGLSADVTVDPGPDGVTPASLSRLQVAFPDGVVLGAHARSASGELSLCSPAAFAESSAQASGCSSATAVGQVHVTVPSAGGVLSGTVYAGAPASVGDLPALFVEAAAGGSTAPGAARVKLVASLVSGGDGRLNAVFDHLPGAPFSDLDLDLGEGGPLTLVETPPACGAYAGVATLTSAVTGNAFSSASTITINQDCSRPAFNASVGLAAATRAAGAVGATAVGVGREDRTPRMRSVLLSGPSGLLADIGGTPECPYSGDAAVSCGAETRIAGMTLTVGDGSAPHAVTANVYLTPRAPGAVAGGSAVFDLRIGDLDLGTLVVPIRFDLRPTDAGINVSFDLPASYHGMSLDVRNAALTFDRPGFTLNPSSCGPLGYSATVVSENGAVATPGGQATYDGCDTMPFAPTLSATLTGETQPLGHPNVSIALNARAGDSNLRGATVTLPRGIAVDLKNITNICPMDQFNAVICSAATRIGTATARVALTPDPIPGDVYLVRIPGQSLPGLGLSFTGRYSQRVLSVVQVVDNRIVVRFDSIPDLPLRRLDMDITGGSGGPIQVSPGTCPAAAVWDASFVAQGRQVSSHTIPSPCAPRDAKRSAITLSSQFGLTWRISDLGGRTLQAAKLTLPKGFEVVRARASRKQFQVLTVAGAKAKLSFSTQSVIVAASTPARQTLLVRLKAGSLKRTKPLRAGETAKRVTVKVRLGFSDGTVQNQSITVRAK